VGIVGDHSGGGAHVDPLQRKAAHGQRPQGIGRHLKGNPTEGLWDWVCFFLLLRTIRISRVVPTRVKSLPRGDYEATGKERVWVF
jgi:hypothetical protein